MKSVRPFCILLCLCLLLGSVYGCASTSTEVRPTVHVTYTPDPTALPAEMIEAIAGSTVVPTSGSEVTALLYAGEDMKLYHGYLQGRPGLFLVSRDWGRTYYHFQELPGTLEQKELTVVGVEVEPLEEPAEACVYIRYLGDDGEERILCADRSHENYSLVYPLSTEPSLTLSEQQEQYYGDLLLMGYLRERIAERAILQDMEGWESEWQESILDVFFYKYGDTLPPYLTGELVEIHDGLEHAAVIQKTELDALVK